jgi:hypothetical protein
MADRLTVKELISLEKSLAAYALKPSAPQLEAAKTEINKYKTEK